MVWSSNSFPGTTSISGCLENWHIYIWMSCCSPIQGTIYIFLLTHGTDLSQFFTQFRTLVLGLQNNGTLECISDSFPGTLTYFLFLEKCWNSISMSSFSPFHVTNLWLVLNFNGTRVWECDLRSLGSWIYPKDHIVRLGIKKNCELWKSRN